MAMTTGTVLTITITTENDEKKMEKKLLTMIKKVNVVTVMDTTITAMVIIITVMDTTTSPFTPTTLMAKKNGALWPVQPVKFPPMARLPQFVKLSTMSTCGLNVSQTVSMLMICWQSLKLLPDKNQLP